MLSALLFLLTAARQTMRTRAALQLEILALRHQLQVLERSRPRRVRLTSWDPRRDRRGDENNERADGFPFAVAKRVRRNGLSDPFAASVSIT